jgi:hypothetical protein
VKIEESVINAGSNFFWIWQAIVGKISPPSPPHPTTYLYSPRPPWVIFSLAFSLVDCHVLSLALVYLCLRCAIMKTTVVALASRSTTAQVLSCLILHHLVLTYHQFCWSWSWSWSWLVSSLYLMFSKYISEGPWEDDNPAKPKVFSYLSVPLSGLVLSFFVLSCFVLSCPVLSCLVLSCLVLSYLVFLHWRVLSWPNFSCLVLSCLLC